MLSHLGPDKMVCVSLLSVERGLFEVVGNRKVRYYAWLH
jgi:hypothetical protein